MKHPELVALVVMWLMLGLVGYVAADIYYGSYVDGGLVYHAPVAFKVTKNGNAWNQNNVAFRNQSGARPNTKGKVSVILSNVTGLDGTFEVSCEDSVGDTHDLQVQYLAFDNASGIWNPNVQKKVASVTNPVALTSAYDPAKTAASQASVNAIPTTPLLAANYVPPPTVTQIDTQLTATHGSGGWTTGTGGGGSSTDYLPILRNISGGVAGIRAKTNNLPSDPASNTQVVTRASQTSVTNLGSPMQAGTNATLAASQPYYAPAKATDPMMLTSSERIVLVNAFLDGTLAGHTASGTTGGALSTASTGGVDYAQLKDAVWTANLGPYTGVGTAGKKLAEAATGSSNGGINVLPFQGSVSYAGPVTSGMEIAMFKGDTPVIPYIVTNGPNKIPTDLTGWTIQRAMKRNVTDTTYALSPKDITSDADQPLTKGTGNIYMLHGDTVNLPPGRYVMDVLLSKTVNTVVSQFVASRFYITINTRVIP